MCFCQRRDGASLKTAREPAAGPTCYRPQGLCCSRLDRRTDPVLAGQRLRAKRLTNRAEGKKALREFAMLASRLIPRRGLFRTFRSSQEHSPMRIADPFIMVTHVIGSFCIIHDLGHHRGCFPGFANTSRITGTAELSGRLCAAAAAELSWKRCPLRWDRPPHCSFHRRWLGPAQYH